MKWLPNDLPAPRCLLEYLELPAQDKCNNTSAANFAQLCHTFTLHTLRNYSRNKGQSQAWFDSSSDSANNTFIILYTFKFEPVLPLKCFLPLLISPHEPVFFPSSAQL